MQINLAHLRERSTSGGWVNFAVFDARASFNCDSENGKLLAQLTTKAQMAGYKVDQSALAYSENGQLKFYGSRKLVDYLSRSWCPRWTHTMTV